MAGTDTDELARAIDAVLPQTQCGACDYPACQPYAKAIARGEAAINQCPPGGDRVVALLASLTGRAVLPLREPWRPPALALIREADCIGCTLCIQACPVDAIVGASKHMHTVIAVECNGCERCLPPCPVDCIELRVLPERSVAERDALAEHWRTRFEAREARLAAEPARRARRLAAKRAAHGHGAGDDGNKPAAPETHLSTTPDGRAVDRRAVLQAALARLRGQRGG
ncbi:MAG: RnfABCDGE type electron transport complex subunit B [Rhodocyclaceae bacterium]|nr:RnfABCDGE type electron transport complex subunit B [Rhodocyclaceae bacterium]